MPSPSAPSSPSPPDSSSADVSVRTAQGANVNDTEAAPGSPASSVPRTVTWAGSAPALISRSRLTWRQLLAGFRKSTRCPPSASGASAFMPVTNPSSRWRT